MPTPCPLVVSIINYKTGALTISAAKSVLEALGRRTARVIIVDNASNDGSLNQISNWIADFGDPRLELISSTDNSGFSGGHNQSISAAPDATFYLVLNSDALLRSDFFEHLLPATEDAPQVGLFAVQLEDEDGTPQISCFRFPSPKSELLRGAKTKQITQLFRRSVIALELPPKQSDIEWASFACILLRGEMVRQIGLMDEGYFLYYEDSEYALRARRAGWTIQYVPAARAVHFRGGSGPVKKMQAEQKRLPAYYWRSRTRFLRQANGPLGPLLGNLFWLSGRCIAVLRLLTGRGIPKAHDREWRDIWTGFMKPLEPFRATKS